MAILHLTSQAPMHCMKAWAKRRRYTADWRYCETLAGKQIQHHRSRYALAPRGPDANLLASNTGVGGIICRQTVQDKCQNGIKQNTELLAVHTPGVVEVKSHSEWPSRRLSSGTSDPNRLACLGIRGKGGHAIEHTKPHLGHVLRFLLVIHLRMCLPNYMCPCA